MGVLRTFSPVVVLLCWAAWIGLFGRSNAAAVFWLVAMAVAMGLHVWEERRARS